MLLITGKLLVNDKHCGNSTHTRRCFYPARSMRAAECVSARECLAACAFSRSHVPGVRRVLQYIKHGHALSISIYSGARALLAHLRVNSSRLLALWPKSGLKARASGGTQAGRGRYVKVRARVRFKAMSCPVKSGNERARAARADFNKRARGSPFIYFP